MKEQITPQIGETLADLITVNPFIPHPALSSGHLQTIAGTLIRRRFSEKLLNSETRLFQTAPKVKVLAHCSWQSDKGRSPAIILLHGMEGSSDSRYMLGTAEKAFRAGFNAIRLNMRNCGGTEHLTPTLYHAGLTDDLPRVIEELVQRDGLREIYLVGFSLGGNVVLKLAGEYGEEAPPELCGVVAVSPSVDLAACASAIESRSNVVYSLRFVVSLRSRMRRKAELFPDQYDLSRLKGAWTIREYDERYVAPHWGFRNAADYYERASALRVAERISLPSLIIHAKDDPFIPYSQFAAPEIESNRNVSVVLPDRGGHVGFISAGEGEGRFWAEKMVVEYVKLLALARSSTDFSLSK